MKKLLLLIVLLLAIGQTTNANAEDARPKIMKVSTMDLLVDGSSTPQTISLTGFPAGSWITVIVLNIHFEDASLDFNGWGAGSALTNGTAALMDGVSFLPMNLTTNHGFGHLSGDLTIFQDDKTPKDNHFVSRFALWEVVPPFGIQMTTNTSFQFLVQDDMTAVANAIDVFEVSVEGFAFLDVPGGSQDETPDTDIATFLENQLRVIVGIWPWLLLICVVAGVLLFLKKKIKLT